MGAHRSLPPTPDIYTFTDTRGKHVYNPFVMKVAGDKCTLRRWPEDALGIQQEFPA